MAQNTAGPGRTGYVLALIVFLVGIVGAVILVAVFAFGLLGLADDLQRVVAPGTGEIELTETGSYTIYYEHRSVVDGTDYDTDRSVPNLSISVTRLDDGQDIQVNPSLMSTNYEVINYAGRSIRTFDVDEPGQYEISAEYTDGRDAPRFVLAVGQGVGRGILTSVGAFLGAGAVFCGLTLAAVVIAGVTLYRRSRAEQQTVENPPSQ